MPATKTSSLQDVFLEYILFIPDYQRGYAWQQRHIADFLDDLDLLTGKLTHYAGTLILDPNSLAMPAEVEDEQGITYKRAAVVDGQQRLTTAVILLAAIAREVELLGDEVLSRGIVRTFVSTKSNDDQPLTKLKLNHDNDSYWERCILNPEPAPDPPKIKSHERLRDARNQIDAYLTKASSQMGDDFPKWLGELREKVVKQLKVMVYEVDSSQDVGTIFETQNNRGLDLTQLEKTKNLLLYIASKLDIDQNDIAIEVNGTWSEILRLLNSRDLGEPESEDTLLRNHWCLFYDPQPRMFHGYDSVKERFSLKRYRDKHPQLANDIRAYISSLLTCAAPYCDVHAPTHSEAFTGWEDSKTRDAIVAYSEKLIGIGQLATIGPLLIACRLSSTVGPEDYLEIVKRCEVFAFRVAASGTRVEAGSRLIFRTALEVAAGSSGKAKVLSTVKEAMNEYAGRSRVRGALADINNWYQWTLLKYFLYEYELHRCGTKHPPKVTWTTVRAEKLQRSVEHILPQKPTDEYWQTRFTPAEISTQTDDLGNLCLTYDNASYQNKSFPEKKGTYESPTPCYAKSPLYQEKDLCLNDDWTPEAINVRGKVLLDFLYDRWEIAAPVRSDGTPYF